MPGRALVVEYLTVTPWLPHVEDGRACFVSHLNFFHKGKPYGMSDIEYNSTSRLPFEGHALEQLSEGCVVFVDEEWTVVAIHSDDEGLDPE